MLGVHRDATVRTIGSLDVISSVALEFGSGDSVINCARQAEPSLGADAKWRIVPATCLSAMGCLSRL